MKQKIPSQSFRFSFLSCLIVLVFVLILSFSFSCSIEEPIAPQWDVNLPIPLINRSITMKELVDKNDFLILNPNGLVSIDFEEELEQYEVGDELKIEGIHETFTDEIGKIEIQSPGTNSAYLTFYDIYPPSSLLDGQTVPVPAFSFNQISTALQGFNNFESVLIESGQIRISLTNKLPIPISNGLQIQVKNLYSDELVFKILCQDAIQSGSTLIKSFNLSGFRVPSFLKIVISGESPGSGSESVYVESNLIGLDVEVYISNIVASEANAIIEDQYFSGSDSLVLGDSIVVTQAKVSSGFLTLTYENHIPLDLRVNLQLKDFYDHNGQETFIDIPINSGERGQRFIDVSDYEFKPTYNEKGSVANFSWDVQVFGSNGNLIAIKSDDNFMLDVHLSELTFSELHGFLKEIRFDLDPYEDSVDLPDGLDSIRFESGQLELLVNNGIGFPINPEINIEGINESTGKSVTLSIQQRIEPANGQSVLSSIILNENNSQIIDFLNISPNKIKVAGSVLIGDGSSESDISSSDFIETSFHITVPLELSFPTQNVKTDVDTIEIGEDAQDELRENVLSGKFFALFGNHLPFGFDVSLHFSGQDTSVYTDPELVIGPLTLLPASVSQTSGRVESEFISEISFDLTQEEIAVFANDKIYLSVLANIPGSNGQMYGVFGDDYLNIKAFCEFKYHVDPEKMSEDDK